jgi:hypothetical protein
LRLERKLVGNFGTVDGTPGASVALLVPIRMGQGSNPGKSPAAFTISHWSNLAQGDRIVFERLG